MKTILWTSWLTSSAAAAVYLYAILPDADSPSAASTMYLPGRTTCGHYQIEMNCSECHENGGTATDASCIRCHAADLKASRDTHVKSKFNDPLKAVLLKKIDATNCLTCHVEHAEDQTLEMGVTVPADYCFHCHEDVAEDRPSHTSYTFDSCTNSGCHNYHDNTALYENFLKTHHGEPALLQERGNPQRVIQQWVTEHGWTSAKHLSANEADAPLEHHDAALIQDWADSAHALMGVNCTGCHRPDNQSDDAVDTDSEARWVSRPDHESCGACHEQETDGFRLGRHGMRLASGLSPMSPAMARLSMHASAAHRQLDCASCHDPHRPDLQRAAFDACVKCHDDEHTRNYTTSAHFELWEAETDGTAKGGTGVSCATCHMPRDDDGHVEHNQNANLRPNEKMARTVCMNCHGLQFTLDALADPVLKTNCYSTAPGTSVNSLEMVQEWFKKKQRNQANTKEDIIRSTGAPSRKND